MKRRTVLIHTVFWLSIYLFWIAVFRSYSVSISKTMTIEFCYLIFITADYYAISNIVIPQFLIKKRYPFFIAATILLVACSAWLRSLVAVQMNRYLFHDAPATDFLTLFIVSFGNISLWVLLIIVGKMMIDKIKSQRELELLEKEKTKSELDYLKAQVNPHALFNSLNTIYGHIDKSNQVARNTLLQFSELLRYQLYDCSAEKVSLEKEINYIKNYVVFQQLRKNENLIVNVEMENTDKGLSIAPLLLIVLIENAFKFVSTSTQKENKISIRLTIKGTILYGSVLNSIELPSQDINRPAKGIGLANLSRRLELLYPGKYKLANLNEKNFYEANLILDLA